MTPGVIDPEGIAEALHIIFNASFGGHGRQLSTCLHSSSLDQTQAPHCCVYTLQIYTYTISDKMAFLWDATALSLSRDSIIPSKPEAIQTGEKKQ